MAKTPQDDRGAAERAMLYNRKPEAKPSKDDQIIQLLEHIRQRIGDIEKERGEFWDALSEQTKVITELEDRSTASEKTFLSLENRLSRTELQEAPLVERLAELENTYKELPSQASEGLHKEILSRFEESDLQTLRLVERVEDAMSMQTRLTRRIDKLVQDKQKINRKLERLEEGMDETRNALAAKAMVLLTDRAALPAAENVNIPVFPKYDDESYDEKLEQRDDTREGQSFSAIPPSYAASENGSFLSGVSSWRGQAVAISGFVIVAALSGWWISQDKETPYSVPYALYEEESSDNTEMADLSVYDDVQEKVASMRSSTLREEDMPAISEQDNFYSSDQQGTYQEEFVQRQSFGTDEDRGEENVAQAMNDVQPAASSYAEDVVEDAPSNYQEYASYTQPDSFEAVETSEAEPEEAQIESQAMIEPDLTLPNQIKVIEREAIKGNPEAQHDLAAIYTAGHANVTPNYERAAYWFEKAADNGIANARYNLGVLYHQGLGVEQNVEKALEWYRKAGQLGHPEAQYNLGIAYIEGIGVSYDPKRAAEYFETAAASGIPEAAFNLGLIYENGLLGEAQLDEALLWYKTAADNGNVDARRAMEQLAKSMNVKPEDIDRLVDDYKTPEATESKAQAPAKQVAVTASKPSSSQRASNNTIGLVQEQLMNQGLYPGPISGDLGPLTQDAIRLYQARHNLNVTGIASEELLAHMMGRKLHINSGMEEIGSREN